MNPFRSCGERCSYLRKECNDLESQRSEDVHDRVHDGRVVVAEGRVREDDEEGVEGDSGVVLLVRWADVRRVSRIRGVERLDESVVRDPLDDLRAKSGVSNRAENETKQAAAHRMPVRIQGAQDSHHANDLSPRMLRRLRLEQPDEDAQQRRMIEVRINHVPRMRRELSHRPERRISLRRRSLIVERVEDEGHERVELGKDVLSSDAGELSKSGED